MTCSRKLLGIVLSVAAFTATFRARAQTEQNANSTKPAPQQDAASDLRVQVVELIKNADEQMNERGQFQKAAEFAQQALDLSRKLGDDSLILEAKMYLASAYYYQGRMPEALEMFQEVAALAKEVGNGKTLSRALNGSAAVLGELGRFEEALSYLYQCMDVAREQRDQSMQHMVLINIGELYVRVGDPDKAEAPLLESLRIAHELKSSEPTKNPSKKATELSLKFLGEMEAAREHYKPALTYLQKVRESRPESEQAIIGLLDSMAGIYQRIGEPQKAVELLDEARDRAKKSGSVSYSITLADLGESQESLGQLNEALASENLALAEVRRTGGNADYEWQIERRIGHIDYGLGRDQEALIHYRNSIHAIELLRSSALNTEPGKAGFTSRSRTAYAETADLLYTLGHADEALEMAERGRARAFVEMLAMIRGGLPDELTSDQAGRESDLQSRISSIQKALWKEGIPAKEEQEQKAKLASAEDDLDAFHVSVRRSNPRYASIRYPQPINAARIQSDLLDNKSVLLEFMLGEKRSLVWVVSKDKVIAADLPPQKEIERQVLEFRKALTDRTSILTAQWASAQLSRVGGALYASLIGPVKKTLPIDANVIVVPDGVLCYLPFEALVTGTRRSSTGEVLPIYALEKYRIMYAPSASALVAVQTLNPRRAVWEKALLAFGDPILEGRGIAGNSTNKPALVRASGTNPAADTGTQFVGTAHADYAERGFSLSRLPFTREEVIGIGKLFPPAQRQLYLGDSATEESVKDEKLDQYRYIHFASHGFMDESAPERSGILFSRAASSREDGVLQASEIMRLKLSAEMVTLSACSTGLGKLVNGEGILGMTHAFFYAGARNLAVSLWNVNDEATAVLMRSFYAQLNRGVSKPEALRQAKLHLLSGSNPTWRQPYFWGAFVLVGTD